MQPCWPVAFNVEIIRKGLCLKFKILVRFIPSTWKQTHFAFHECWGLAFRQSSTLQSEKSAGVV